MKAEEKAVETNFYVKSSEDGLTIELVDNIEMTNDFKQNVCLPYFKDIYKDLAVRSDTKNKGISRVTFLEFIGLPGLIGDRLFNVFDIGKDGIIDITEFIISLFKLYSTDFNVKMKFVFDMYDFDKDGFITKEDVKTLLSSVPIKKMTQDQASEGKFTKNEGGVAAFGDRIESQKELILMTEINFDKKIKLSLEDFRQINEKQSSEMFLCLYVILRQKLPSFTQFQKYEQKSSNRQTAASPYLKVLPSPKILSKFSPLSGIVQSNSPQIKEEHKAKEAVQSQFAPKNPTTKKHPPSKFVWTEEDTTNVNSVRKPNTIIQGDQVTQSPSIKLKGDKVEILFCSCGNIIHDFNILLCDQCIINEKEGKTSGYLHKIKKTGKVSKYWIIVEKKEIVTYVKEGDNKHKSIHSLKGCFFEESESKEIVEGIDLYTFSIYWNKKCKKYGCIDLVEFKKWTKVFKNAIGYSNINDFYDIKENIGKGKFGIVTSAIHKKTGVRVAVKKMKKAMMSQQDIELVFREIEILKLCQHPNIVKLIDVFENRQYISIVMECLEGGDLFTYLDTRKFNIPEPTAARIIHSLASALFYLHSFGIVHRDMKPENVLMINKNENSDVKIVDFGLSKIIGPGEKCTEPFGTLSYVAPEVLQQMEYGKPVDIWSLGVMAYLMLVGFLPFDDENEKEIAKLTIFEEPDYNHIKWALVSPEAINFVKNCLMKNSEKRITLIDVLQHKWLMKNNKVIKELRRSSLPLHKFSAFSISNPEDKIVTQIMEEEKKDKVE